MILANFSSQETVLDYDLSPLSPIIYKSNITSNLKCAQSVVNTKIKDFELLCSLKPSINSQDQRNNCKKIDEILKHKSSDGLRLCGNLNKMLKLLDMRQLRDLCSMHGISNILSYTRNGLCTKLHETLNGNYDSVQRFVMGQKNIFETITVTETNDLSSLWIPITQGFYIVVSYLSQII